MCPASELELRPRTGLIRGIEGVFPAAGGIEGSGSLGLGSKLLGEMLTAISKIATACDGCGDAVKVSWEARNCPVRLDGRFGAVTVLAVIMPVSIE